MRFNELNLGVELPENVERVLFDFVDKDYIRVPGIPLYRLEISGKRYYVRTDEEGTQIYPSVTNILGEVMPMEYGLLKWYVDNGFEKAHEILDKTSAYGTEMHKLFTDLILGGKIELNELTDNQKQDCVGFVKWVKDYNVKPLAVEYVVYGNGYAGAVDLVCKMEYEGKEIVAMVDYKTGRNNFYLTNILQLEAYRQRWDGLNPDIPIDKIFNYGCKNYRIPIGKSVTPYRFEDQTGKPATKNWDYYLAIYKNNHSEINTKEVVYTDIELDIETDVSTAFKEIDRVEELNKEVENEQD